MGSRSPCRHNCGKARVDHRCMGRRAGSHNARLVPQPHTPPTRRACCWALNVCGNPAHHKCAGWRSARWHSTVKLHFVHWFSAPACQRVGYPAATEPTAPIAPATCLSSNLLTVSTCFVPHCRGGSAKPPSHGRNHRSTWTTYPAVAVHALLPPRTGAAPYCRKCA